MIAGGVRNERERVIDLTFRHRHACALPERKHVESGGPLSYGPRRKEDAATTVRLANYADRILGGAKPADLPADQPTRYALEINLKTAQALGASIAQSILLHAPTR